MAPFQKQTEVFLIRIWCEPREIEGAPPEWRGCIEHLASRERRYLRDLDVIGAFIKPYLRAIGIELPESRGRAGWLTFWMRSFRTRR